ncbi:hypothetical protein ACFLT9_10315 [Acidobacteriota bacterium]
MKISKTWLILIGLCVLCIVLSANSAFHSDQLDNNSQEIQELEDSKQIPGPKSQQESIGLYVFLGWIWVAIIVLIYFLRLKIIEADRLLDLNYYKDAGENKHTASQGS